MQISLILFPVLAFSVSILHGQSIEVLQKYNAPAANQAVAVDANYFYAISNNMIEKYAISTGKLIRNWQDSTGVFKHLNSGVIKDDKLYCAHSNFPDIPMASSIEIFDPGSLEPVESHSFGLDIGSATWIDWYDGHWYVAFAHYNRFKEDNGMDNRWTQLVKFSPDWHRLEGWLLPGDLIERFDGMSNSGGYITSEGKIYLTGHDDMEVYVLEFPDHGYTLQWTNSLESPFEGQGIAADPENRDIIYGINRSQKMVIKGKVIVE